MSRVGNGRANRAGPGNAAWLAIAFGTTGFLCGFAPAAFAQPGQSASAQGTASATVVAALQASQEQDLSFGAIIAGEEAGGEVTVDPAGGPARYGGGVRPACTGSAGGCHPHPARFAVSGEAERSYAITLPAEVTARGQRTGSRLSVRALAARSGNRPLGDGGQLDKQGKDTFTIGGILIVPAGTAADVFRANLPVVVHYD